MLSTLDRFKNLPPCTAEALVAALGEILPQVAGTQERYKVTDVPTIRTLRFCMSQGLMDKPQAYVDRTALYGYRHLLQVVVIKYLQANHLPIRKMPGDAPGDEQRGTGRTHRHTCGTGGG